MKLVSYYSPLAPRTMVYMLQQVEYQPQRFIDWLLHTPDLETVMRRNTLKNTKNAVGLMLCAYVVWLCIGVTAVGAIVIDAYLAAFVIVLLSPLPLALGLLAITVIGNAFLHTLVYRPLLIAAQNTLSTTGQYRIAILGSYAKTSTKEVLSTVLSAGSFKVAATPGNKNVPISHARWAQQLDGDEHILLIEYGEGKPGDIRTLATISSPTHAILTGIAPNHLDRYKTMDALVKDFTDIFTFVPKNNVTVHAQTKKYMQVTNDVQSYGNGIALGWRARDIKYFVNRTEFQAEKGQRTIQIVTSLLGAHNVDTLLLAIAIADEFGFTDDQIVSGVAATKPVEHRMNPYMLNGAWIIDDTYNGNIEGMKAGLRVLQLVDGRRKIYVTPGLVDQGDKISEVHHELAHAITEAHPDIVVVMVHKDTSSILEGLAQSGYKGHIIQEKNPLRFYQNIEHFIVAGDVVMLQNDLPDAYR